MHRRIRWICALLVLILCQGALASDCPFWKRSCQSQPERRYEKRDFTPPSSRVMDPYSYSCTKRKVLKTCFFGNCSKTYCKGDKICITPEQDKGGKLKQADCLEVEINNLECSGQDQIKQQYYNVQYDITVEGVEKCPFDKPVCDAGECVAKKEVSDCKDEDNTNYEALSGIQSQLNGLLLKKAQLEADPGNAGSQKLMLILNEIYILTYPSGIKQALATLLTAKSVTGPDSSTGQVITKSDECKSTGVITEYACNKNGQMKDFSLLCNLFGPKSTCFADQKPNCVPTDKDKCLMPAKCVGINVQVQQIIAGAGHTCALMADQTVKCWGNNGYGQLGDGTASEGPSKSTPTPVLNLGNVKQITTGDYHTCALLGDQTVSCWGVNVWGQLGDGTSGKGNSKSTPTPVLNLGNVKQITAGGAHACALLSDQAVKCWGFNVWGQLGDGTSGESNSKSTPTPVLNLGNVKQITEGGGHTCALLGDQTVKCWGNNEYGQLGDGTSGNTGLKLIPTPVPSLKNVKQIEVGGMHTCALLSDQTVKCWGHNGVGQLGNGTSGYGQFKSTPTSVVNLGNVKQLALGFSHTCALLNDSTVKCWGWNESGQLGDGTKNNKLTPVSVPNLWDVEQIETGDTHTCALLNNQTVKCWGKNDSGQLGDGTTEDQLTPVEVKFPVP